MSGQPVALLASAFCAFIALILSKGAQNTIASGRFFLGSFFLMKPAGYERNRNPFLFWAGVASIILGAAIGWLFAIASLLAGFGFWN